MSEDLMSKQSLETSSSQAPLSADVGYDNTASNSASDNALSSSSIDRELVSDKKGLQLPDNSSVDDSATGLTDVKHTASTLIRRLECVPLMPFHHLIALLLGLGLLFDGLDTLIIAVLLPPIVKTFQIDPARSGILIAAGFLGQAIGALIFGYVSERFGRKLPLVIALMISGLFSIVAALAPSLPILLLGRVLQGLGLGACPPLATALFNEYVPSRRRGKNGLFVQIYLTLGYMLSPFLAILVFAFIRPEIGWRLLFAIGALPIVIAPLVYFLVPESVRWLAGKGNIEEANTIVTNLEQKAIQRNLTLQPAESIEIPVAALQQQKTRFGELFAPQYRRRTLQTWIQWFTSFFILVGFSSWLPSLYVHPGGLTEQQALLPTFFLGFGTIGFLLLYAFTVDTIGRKRWFVIGFLLAAVGAISGALLLGPLHAVSWITLAIAGILMSLGAYICVTGSYIYTSEVYPTRMRSWALSTGRSWSSLASIIAPIIIGVLVGKHLSIAIVFLLLCIVALHGLVVVVLLGEETKQQLLEKLAQ